ncbi:MAG: hypothetical protein H0T79_14540 [Deltaproteobacteria bacterium]|nr:hypothetical protein [Deltaproteobacteria bacterium]
MTDVPLLIEFVVDTTIYREPDFVPRLPILQNGPPGTFIVFADGRRVSLPTDQIVFSDDTGARARVGFGGMRYVGIEDGFLVFLRVRDLQPPETLPPGRGRRMTLKPEMVSTIYVDGGEVWPLLA